jgi:histidyl-tRNA synthetase
MNLKPWSDARWPKNWLPATSSQVVPELLTASDSAPPIRQEKLLAKIQAIRGMNDVLPDQTPLWQYVENCARSVLASYAYQEIRFPIVEQTQLFKRSIGEVTDIVEKEMYTFEDRNGDSLSLRPEGTACCVRAAEQHGLLYNQLQKLWYMGPMFRHERPQKGRYRQFYQLGVETFGMSGVEIEAELIMMSMDLWQTLGIANSLALEINNLGSSADRARYGAALKDYLTPLASELDADSQRRLGSNVLRILDSKHPQTRELLKDAPVLADFVEEPARQDFEKLLDLLARAGINANVTPGLVRGLDYYNGTVFEWTTESLGAQGTLCAGGRFDGLSRQLGGTDTPAAGFAIGLERLILMLEATDNVPAELHRSTDVYVIAIGDQARQTALLLSHHWRRSMPGVRFLTHCGAGKYNTQLKKAYHAGARAVVILEGEAEVTEARIRAMADDAANQVIPLELVEDKLRSLLV